MLSKLTFSLALVLMLAFLATSAMAQTADDVGAIAADGDFALVGRTTTPGGVIVPTGASITELSWQWCNGCACLIWRISYVLVARSNCNAVSR